MADLLGADPRGIVFGRSATQLTFDLARTLAAGWGPGDEVVVTRLDHDANVRPWVLAAEAAGATVRWIAFDPATGELTADDVAAVLTERTRLVAVTGASNLIGTRPPVAEIAALVHDAGALLAVDGVHLTAHAPVDVRGPRRGLLHLLAVQVPRPALRRAGRGAGPAGDARAGQAAAVVATRSPSGSSSARCPTSCWPARRRRSTSSPASPRADGTPARAAGRLDDRRSRRTRTGCASTSRRGSPSCPASALWSRAAHRTPDPAAHLRRPGRRRRLPRSSPSAASTPRPARSTRSRPAAGSASATPAACGSASRPTPTRRRRPPARRPAGVPARSADAQGMPSPGTAPAGGSGRRTTGRTLRADGQPLV